MWRWRAPRGRRTPIICEGSLVSDTTDPLFADGRLHWMLTERAADGAQGDLDGILAFVLGNESFKRIPLPPLALPSADHPPGYPPPLGATLAELDGRLCLLQDLRRRKHGVALFDLWMLRDLTSGSWSLDRRIDLKPHVDKELMLPLHVSVLCYVGGEIPAKSKKKILLATTMGRVYLYDQDTGELHTVAKNKGCAKQYMRLVLYQDCIVQFDGMEYGKEDIKFKLVTEESNSEPGVAFHSEV
ncbi:hypothetical protein PVAP13_7KG127755 [Panicum virgatum]|uniref:F-box protein n=1 Tax=Panicum virgatum TaxID=38727 RepID=A0A8T0QKX4_PANVG|nr:hypothetical protein PVAP13_7KG127755 [Panicum virgatum]